ncbi:MAG: phenylalanine--tRNA ligase subunit beta [Candidatus Adlerbacteria bacterium]|nr:phenylalanine--tRNA ligase subunit beta [Candidatus Adlerbacteria bacterium]
MKVSKLWLDKFFDAPLPDAEKLSDALTFHAFEIDGVEKVGEDEVLDVKVTPNRGHDALSHRGIAKELSAILKLPLAHDPFAVSGDLSKKTAEVSVSIQSNLCKRYIAGYIKGVKVGPSPKWLKERLEAIGQRSINNVVDATNFVMFNTGQPLHAFDARKLGSLDIGVRLAKAGEKMLALDEKEYTLNDSTLVITAGDIPVGIAGIKGGMPAGITADTQDIVIESANFDGVTVRKSAAALKLRTDASARFEQGISPGLAAEGMKGMLEFIAHQIGGEVQGFVDVYPEPQKQTYVAVTVEQINKVLGADFTGADIADVFTRLGLAYKEQEGVFEVQPPFERLDLIIAEDLIEEVGRIVGYDKIPATPLPTFEKTPEINQNFYTAEKVREELLAAGYSEVFTSVFAPKGERVVLNKVDGVNPYLRTTLVDGLNAACKKNIPNKELLGLKEVKLFEIGVVWPASPETSSRGGNDGKEVQMVGIVTEKEPAMEEPLQMHAPDVFPAEYQNLPLSTAVQYIPFSKYPYIVRDVAFWTPAGTDEKNVAEMIKTEAGELCSKISLFDTFSKGEKTSLAFRLIFQSFDRTLTEVEVNKIMEEISHILVGKGFEVR